MSSRILTSHFSGLEEFLQQHAALLAKSTDGTVAVFANNAPAFYALTPDRLVYGIQDDTSLAKLREVYAPILALETPEVVTDLETSELVKVAANAFLATKISFINAFAEVTETVGGDIKTLADAIGHDARIGRKFLNAGVGFGGGCLPKDIRAL